MSVPLCSQSESVGKTMPFLTERDSPVSAGPKEQQALCPILCPTLT
jgi:hypothetical protein